MAPVSRLPLESFRPKSIQTENCMATVYEGLSPVTDMANHTGLWLEKNEAAIKGIHVRNGYKPCYLLPRQQMEKHIVNVNIVLHYR